jgi:hypothetical protein
MHISERLNALFQDEDTRIKDLADRLAIARSEADEAYTAVATAALAMEEGDQLAGKRKQKAQTAYDGKIARVSDLEAALDGAHKRRAARHQQLISAGKLDAEAERKKATAELVTAAAEFDRALAVLVGAARAGLSATHRLAEIEHQFAQNTGMGATIQSANAHMGNAVNVALAFVPGIKIGLRNADEPDGWAFKIAKLFRTERAEVEQ